MGSAPCSAQVSGLVAACKAIRLDGEVLPIALREGVRGTARAQLERPKGDLQITDLPGQQAAQREGCPGGWASQGLLPGARLQCVTLSC